MQLQFDAHQDYQLQAIAAAVDVFAGQSDASHGAAQWSGAQSALALDIGAMANRRVIDDAQLLKNLHAVQHRHGIAPSAALEVMRLQDGTAVGHFPNFTVEMETGTGKTYVYLRTIYELAKTWGFRKFVIVVPSVAIREGVLSSLRATHAHLQMLYSHTPVYFTAYTAARIHTLRNFSLSNAIQILVINMDAFAKDVGQNGKTKGNVSTSGAKPAAARLNLSRTPTPL